jgi:hypothetical protein
MAVSMLLSVKLYSGEKKIVRRGIYFLDQVVEEPLLL